MGGDGFYDVVPTIISKLQVESIRNLSLMHTTPYVKVEVAPSNARRIYCGIDILASMEAIWQVMTTYETLQNVVPSLVKNNVVERYPDGGARLAQVGGAKVFPGVTFTAKTVLDVRVFLEDNPVPDNFMVDMIERSLSLPLQRNVFPRPLHIAQLPYRDITMQNVEGEGDFDHYQGVWRMQSLPNCAPNGGDAARLTYALEIKPKGMLPVALIEGRIASDLKANMAAIRDCVERQQQVGMTTSLTSVASGTIAATATSVSGHTTSEASPTSSSSVLSSRSSSNVIQSSSSGCRNGGVSGVSGNRGVLHSYINQDKTPSATANTATLPPTPVLTPIHTPAVEMHHHDEHLRLENSKLQQKVSKLETELYFLRTRISKIRKLTSAYTTES